MKIDRGLIEDQLLYEIMYFSPVEVGDERYTTQLYFQTDIYKRTWPVSMIDKILAQIDQLRHVELGIQPCDDDFKTKHRDAVMFHCKMALAYLDAREARIAMKLCEVGKPSTGTSDPQLAQDAQVDLNFLRITMLSVLACAACRVKMFQKAIDALSEAKDICMHEGEQNRTHPLMKVLTLLSLSSVLGEIDHDEHALRWGLEALSMMYSLFSTLVIPEAVQAYYFVLACHNAALLNVKLGKWAEAVELVNEGMEFTKSLNEQDDGLRKKLIAIGAQAKHVPEGFLEEAVNALNGWGEGRDVWNLSFWDFSVHEIVEEIHVLRHTKTLKHLIIENVDLDRRYDVAFEDAHLAQFTIAVVQCEPLETFTISGIDFNPHKVWRRIKKPSFLETSWYASPMNFSTITDSSERPEVASYSQHFQSLNPFSRKLVLFLVVLGNECEGIDLANNLIDGQCISALVTALRCSERPAFTCAVANLSLRSNELDVPTAKALTKIWEADKMCSESDKTLRKSSTLNRVMVVQQQSEVESLDVSNNNKLGDEGFELLASGMMQFEPFRILKADDIGLTLKGCSALEKLASTRLEQLSLSNNAIGSEGAQIVCNAAMSFRHLHTLRLDNCQIDQTAAKSIATLVPECSSLLNLFLNRNQIGSQGVIELCKGAAVSVALQSLHIAYNEIYSQEAAEAISNMMLQCSTLLEINLSGNHISSKGATKIGSAIEHSKVLRLYLEDMDFTRSSIDEFLDHGAAETQDLQLMVLDKNPVGDEGLSIISECLSIGLTDLSLSSCNITMASQATLLNLVSLSPNLRTLDLSNNDLGPNGCADMVMWMTQNDKDHFALRSLELANCRLGNDGFFQLVSVLSFLSYLGVSSNSITSAGLHSVMNSTSMIQLKTLDLASNHIGEEGVHSLTERFQKEHKKSLWNPKQLTSNIEKVILTNNDIHPSLAHSTDAFLKKNNPLLTIIW